MIDMEIMTANLSVYGHGPNLKEEMDPLLRVVVNRPNAFGKQIEVLQVQQKESYFNLVTESNTIFFSPRFQGRMRCGSKFIDTKSMEPVAAYLGKGYPLVIDAPSTVPWWIVHIHEGEHRIRPPGVASVETLSFYKLHSGDDFLVANAVEQMVNGGMPEPMLEAFLRELPKQLEPCLDLPATGNRRLAEKLRQKILETEDKQINLKDTADQLDCHPSQLSRVFRRLFGIAPYKFSFLLPCQLLK